MTNNNVTNLLLMIGVGLVAGSIAATVSLAIGINAGTSLLTGAIAGLWGAAMTLTLLDA